MSIPQKSVVNCSKCGRSFKVTVFASINTDFKPDIAERIINGEIFTAKCPKCGNTVHLEYDVLYHDMKHDAMIWVIHKNKNYNERITEIRSIRQMRHKKSRIVYDIDALREKVACLESGKDDRVIELCKIYLSTQLMNQNPDYDFRKAFYTFSRNTDIVFFYDAAGEEMYCILDNQVYNQVADLFADSIKEVDNYSFSVIDSNWAYGVFKTVSEADFEDGSKCENIYDDTEVALKREAEEKGVTVEQLLAIRRMEQENKELLERKKKEQEQLYLKQREISKVVKEEYSDFDFDESIKDPVFSKLIKLEYDMKRVYEFVNREQLFDKRAVMQNSQSSNLTVDECYAFLLEHNRMTIPDDYSKKPLAEIEIEANELGITAEQLKSIRKMESDNYILKQQMDGIDFKKIAEAAVATKLKYPSFELKTEWANDEFREIVKELDLPLAYEFLHFSDLYVEKGRGNGQKENDGCEKTDNAIFCRMCGQRIPLDSVFCYKCGTRVLKE